MRRWTLRRTLPIGVTLLVALTAIASLAYAFVTGGQALREQARLDVLQTAQRLARMAQRGLHDDRQIVAVELAHSATDPRISALAIVGPTSHIEIAHRTAWHGRPAAEVMPGFSDDRFERAKQRGLPDLQFAARGTGISVLMPFAMPTGDGTLRRDRRGAVYVDFDLRAQVASLRAHLLRTHAPMLAALLLLLLLLPFLLHRLVVLPLAALEAASRGLAMQPGVASEPVPEAGPAEVASLASSFNQMARAVQSAQQAHAASEERLLSTFDLAAVGIAHVAIDGSFLRVNRKLCEILGYGGEQLLRLRFQDITVDEDLDKDLAQVKRLLDGEAHSYAIEKRYRHADGSVVWASLSVTLVRDAAGNPMYFISVIEDISERRRAAASLLAAKAAERASAAKTEFLSRMSHELRTPLNAVLGFAQLLRMDPARPLAPQQEAKVQHIQAAGDHLLGMINDVLDLARIESGDVTVACTNLAIAPAVREALALVATSADENDVRLESCGPPPAAPGGDVLADPLRLRQVLVNLLSNAVKYNRRGGSVVLRWGAAPGKDRVFIEVRDTGRGMSEKQLARLFEPFNRLGAEQTGIEGTGIGLVVTRRLVQLMDGAIAVQSDVGVGTSFEVVLPAATGERRDVAAAVGAAVAAPTAQPVATVLYAEDNAINAQLVSDLLAMRADFRLVVACSGEAALAAAREQRPDIVLIDMQLGDMTGMQLRSKLAEDPRMNGIPCIALSADAMPASIDAALHAGFSEYLSKPLNLRLLLQALTRALQSGRLAGAPPRASP